nr:MAG TPA: hypothetical protein [Caudoviricetes sp.]
MISHAETLRNVQNPQKHVAQFVYSAALTTLRNDAMIKAQKHNAAGQ